MQTHRTEQPVVVDTGLSTDDKDFVSWLSDAIDPVDVRWIWLTHPDRDHTGGLHDLLEAAPQARVVTTFIGVGILGTERPLPMDRVCLLNPGQQLDVGDRTLSGLRPPLFDNPATVDVVDHRTGALFSSDCFGAPLPTAEHALSGHVHDVAAGPVPSLPPIAGASVAPRRRETPPVATSRPKTTAERPISRRATIASAVKAAPLARNQTCVETASGPSVGCR